jgi:hypothetical protein
MEQLTSSSINFSRGLEGNRAVYAGFGLVFLRFMSIQVVIILRSPIIQVVIWITSGFRQLRFMFSQILVTAGQAILNLKSSGFWITLRYQPIRAETQVLLGFPYPIGFGIWSSS